jgi:hypothetical protein
VRNEALLRLEPLLGDWDLTMSNAWFLEGPDPTGSATIEWSGDAFVVMRSEMGGTPAWDFTIGHRDSENEYVALYHDERGVCRVYDMTFADGVWAMLRTDSDFHQRFSCAVEPDRIHGAWEMSEDQGHSWRKDFDLTFQRRA